MSITSVVKVIANDSTMPKWSFYHHGAIFGSEEIHTRVGNEGKECIKKSDKGERR